MVVEGFARSKLVDGLPRLCVGDDDVKARTQALKTRKLHRVQGSLGPRELGTGESLPEAPSSLFTRR